MVQRLNPGIFILIFLCAAMYTFFPLKLQAVESYIYATAIEGNYDIRSTFAEANPGARLPDFARLHPNHPLPHFLAGKLFDKFGFSALDSMRVINLFAALIAVIFIYLICCQVLTDRASALLGAALAASTSVFWGSALSGEVHMLAFALLTVAAYYLVRFLSAAAFDKTALCLAAFYFTLAGIIHLAALYLVLPVLPALWIKARADKSPQKNGRLYVTIAALCLLGLILVYVLLPVMYYGFTNRKDFLDFFSIYAHLKTPELRGLAWLETITGAYLQSFIGGTGTWTTLTRVALTLCLLWGYALLLKSGAHWTLKTLFLAAPLAYFNFFFTVRPDAINGWLFVLPSTAIAGASAFQRLRLAVGTHLFSYALTLAVAAAVFFAAIFPNAKLKPEDYAYLSEFQPTGLHGKNAIVITKDPVLTFPDVYAFSHRRDFSAFKIIWACCGRTAYLEDLKSAILKREVQLIISDDLGDNIHKFLHQLKQTYNIVFEKSGIVQASWLPSSIYFTRPEGYIIRKRMQVIRLD